MLGICITLFFPSKESLAKELLLYTARIFGDEIRKINEMDISTKEKIKKIVELYFKKAKEEPELVDYFMREGIFIKQRDFFKWM
ncbi:MAG: hypothetical protein ABGX23_06445 [Nautiliaceae bacterium]